MEVLHYEKYAIINYLNYNSCTLLVEFLNQNSSDCPNLIINMLELDMDEDLVITTLLPFYLNWQKRNKSFILVSNFRKESLQGVISIKSLEEAIDFFHMDDLTRNI
tara:strand:+ start:77 stop:394 length:318 start_codon:yes stop_codon:yes gene_type:complete